MDQEATKIAESKRLEPFNDLAMIATVAERFSLDPDLIYDKPFNFVLNFVVMWREQEGYARRLREANKAMTDSKTETNPN